jgi:hypothetical protein
MAMRNKEGLDEMQIQRRNKIGNQTFIMLMYLLLLDAGLYGFGFRWVAYPANVIILLSLSSGMYVVRLLIGGAYVGPSKQKGNSLLRILFTGLVAAVVAAGMLVLLKTVGFSNASYIDNLAAPLLFITALVGMIIATVVAIIKWKQEKDL